MAGTAIVDDAGVIEAGRQEARGLMTVAAVGVGWYMVLWFAGGKITVVTGSAVAGNSLVVKAGACKCCGVMTQGTILVGRDMAVGFAGGIGTVMAGPAVTGDAFMVEYRIGECTRNMTHAAIFGSRQMANVHTHGVSTIVAGVTTGIQHLGTGVVDISIEKISGVVTGTTIRSCRIVKQGVRGSSGTYGSVTAVVAGLTIAGDAVMTEYCRQEAGVAVTETTVLFSRYVVSSLDKARAQKTGAVTASTASG